MATKQTRLTPFGRKVRKRLIDKNMTQVELGIIVGKSGQGKTHALKKYAELPRVAYIECDDTMACRDLVEAIENGIGLPKGYGGTIWSRVNRIREFFNTNEGFLLIIDEADKLINKYTQKKMEILRGIPEGRGL